MRVYVPEQWRRKYQKSFEREKILKGAEMLQMRLNRAKKSPFYTEIVKIGLILTYLKLFVGGGGEWAIFEGKCPMPPVASPMQQNESGHVDGHVDFFVSGVLSKTEEFSCIILSRFVKILYNIRCCRHLFHYVIVIHNKKHDVHSAWVFVTDVSCDDVTAAWTLSSSKLTLFAEKINTKSGLIKFIFLVFLIITLLSQRFVCLFV